MNQNKQNNQSSNNQGISSSGSRGQMEKQAGGSPSYEDERKDKTKGMGNGAEQPQQSTEDVTVAQSRPHPQTTLNTSGVQEGEKGNTAMNQGADVDSDQQSEMNQGEAQRRSA